MGQSRSARARSVVLVAVIAVVLGTLGTFGVSYAAGVTEDQVKAIAKKVVKKEGKKLTVKNTKKLNGKPASAYQDTARVFQTTITTPTSAVTIPLPLGPGSYQVSYGAYLLGAGSGFNSCFLTRRTAGGDAIQHYAEVASEDSAHGHSGTAVVGLAAGQKLELHCSATSAFTTYDNDGIEPIQVAVIPLDTAATTAIAPQRGTGPRPH